MFTVQLLHGRPVQRQTYGYLSSLLSWYSLRVLTEGWPGWVDLRSSVGRGLVHPWVGLYWVVLHHRCTNLLWVALSWVNVMTFECSGHGDKRCQICLMAISVVTYCHQSISISNCVVNVLNYVRVYVSAAQFSHQFLVKNLSCRVGWVASDEA